MYDAEKSVKRDKVAKKFCGSPVDPCFHLDAIKKHIQRDRTYALNKHANVLIGSKEKRRET